MIVTRLDWDSEFFRYQIGLLKSDAQQFNQERLKEKARSFRLVYVTSPTPLESPLLKCGDSRLIYAKRPINHGAIEGISEARENQLEQFRKIGLESGICSRFALDKNFASGEFIKLYNKWVDRSVRHEIAYRTLTRLEKGQPTGLITLGNDGPKRSSIGLFAVTEAHRGKGVGKQLLQAADTISFERGDDRLTVSTQGKNGLAQEVYIRFGFDLIGETYVYNYWNESYPVQ